MAALTKAVVNLTALLKAQLTLAFVSAKDLKISPAYQRTVKRRIVKKIKSNFMPEALGAHIVGRRADGTMWVVDAQQRYTGVTELADEHGEKNVEVPCVIFESDGPAHEAAVFLAINRDRVAANRPDVFKALLKEGNLTARDIVKILKKYEMNFACFAKKNKTKYPNIEAVGKVMDIYERNGAEFLETVLYTIKTAWENQEKALSVGILAGVAFFIQETAGFVAIEDFISSMRRVTPKRVLAVAGEYAAATGGSRAKAVAPALVRFYNDYAPRKAKRIDIVHAPRLFEATGSKDY